MNKNYKNSNKLLDDVIEKTYLKEEIIFLRKENQELKDRIDKAVEYIENKENLGIYAELDTNKLLEILKGDKE